MRYKHVRKKQLPNFLVTARGIAHGYLSPKHRPKKETTVFQALCLFISVVFVLDLALMSLHISTITPYAITSDGETICYAKTKEDAEKAIEESYQKIVSDDAKVTKAESNLNIKKASLKERRKVADDPADAIVDKALEEDTNVVIELSTFKTETETVEPEVVYEADDSMLAGQSEVISEGKGSENEIAIRETIVNGKSVKTEKVNTLVVNKGEPTVIKKGTKGLPEGENYETYEGYPICKDGKDIMDTAASYIGKVPYVWGGKSLETGVDCSGFVIAIYKLYGVNLGYPLEKEGISVPYSEAKPGDILVFPGHFGLYLGNGKMIHASRPGTYVMESSVSGYTITDVRRIITE